MLRRILVWAGIMLLGIGSLQAARPQGPSTPAAAPASQYRAVLNRYCATCHNEKLKTAGLLLDKADVANVPAGAEIWEKVIRNCAVMPCRLPACRDRIKPRTIPLLSTWRRRLIARPLPSPIRAGRRCIG